MRAHSQPRSPFLTKQGHRGSGGDPNVEFPVFVGEAGRCPSKDVGGPDSFVDFLEAILDPAYEEHRAMLDWYGGPFDRCGFDEARARFGMENVVR